MTMVVTLVVTMIMTVAVVAELHNLNRNNHKKTPYYTRNRVCFKKEPHFVDEFHTSNGWTDTAGFVE